MTISASAYTSFQQASHAKDLSAARHAMPCHVMWMVQQGGEAREGRDRGWDRGWDREV